MNQPDSASAPSRHYWDRPNPSPPWRWLLSRAKADGTGLRRWQQWIWWSRPRTARERLTALVTLATAPLTTAIDAYRLLREAGAEVEHTHGMSCAAQYQRMLQLWFAYGVPPKAYYKYQLYLPERAAHARNYVEEATRLLQVIARRIPKAADDNVFVDKRAFEAWCRNHGLPSVFTIADFEDGQTTRHISGNLPMQSLFSKPTNLRAGMGARLWSHKRIDGASYWSGSAETETDLTADQLEAHLASLSQTEGRPFVLQPCLTNHPTIQSLSKGRLSTIRLMTIRGDPSAEARPLLAVLRIPVGDAIADNFDAGGIAVPVDLSQGICGKGVRKKAKFPLQPVSHHPDTGAALDGLGLPFWQDTVRLGLRAHNALSSHMPIVGWDIAILSDGPILIESNHFPCGNLAQMPTGTPLAETEYSRLITTYLRKAFL